MCVCLVVLCCLCRDCRWSWLSLACFVITSFFFFKQKTAYELRISDWSSDVCSSDLLQPREIGERPRRIAAGGDDEPGGNQRVGDSISADQRQIEIGRASCRERVCQYV